MDPGQSQIAHYRVRTHVRKIGRVGRQAGGSGEEGRGGTKTGVCFLEQKAVKTTVLACAY